MSYPTIVEATQARDAILERMSLADIAYYDHDEPVMEDAEYDDLKLALGAIEGDYPALVTADSPTQKVSGTATSAFEKVAHAQRMESLDNSFSDADVAKWAATNAGDEAVIGELKMDGLSLSLTYYEGALARALTRGDGTIGEDVTHTAHEIEGLPLLIPTLEEDGRLVEVRGEVYLPKAAFEAYNARVAGTKKKPLVNCRNGAAGALRQKDAAVTRERGIRFMAFGVADASLPDVDSDAEVMDILEGMGFDAVPRFVIGSQPAAITTQIEKYAAARPDLPFEIDGIVFKINSRSRRKKLGSTSKFPRGATAYKFPAERRTTRLREIKVQVGRTGAQTPVGVLEPVFVGGVTVSNVTLHNEDEIRRLHLVPGVTVIVQRAGDVIPQIVGVDPKAPVVKGIYTFPTECASCGSVTVREEGQAVRRCVNAATCPAQRQGHLEHFVSRAAMNIDGLGPSQIKDLIGFLELRSASQIMALPDSIVADLRIDPADIHEDMTVTEAMQCWKGYGKGSVAKLMSAIKKARTQPLDRFIYSLGIRNVGSSTAKDIAKHLGTVDAFFEAIIHEDGFFTAGVDTIDGVGPVVMASIDQHFTKQANYEEAFALRRIMDLTDMPKASTSSIRPLTGEVICFTGSLNRWSRDQARLIAEELGAKTINSAAKQTTILITGEGVGAVKIKKAEDQGTRCETEDWFIGIVEDAVSQGYVLDVMD